MPINLTDAASLLSYGIIGLGFLLALLSFYLLFQRPAKSGPIYVFMAFSIAILLLGLGREYLAFSFDRVTASMSAQIERLNSELVEKSNRINDLTTQVDGLNTRIANTKVAVGAAITGVAEFMEVCRREAYGASTNTSDLPGCLAAAGSAMRAGEGGDTRIGDLRRILAEQ